MKRTVLAGLVALLSTSAFAQATLEANDNSKSQGSTIGVQSSAATGNGDWVSGNGTGAGPYGAGDQTTYAGSRADAVHDAQSAAGENGGNARQGSQR